MNLDKYLVLKKKKKKMNNDKFKFKILSLHLTTQAACIQHNRNDSIIVQ